MSHDNGMYLPLLSNIKGGEQVFLRSFDNARRLLSAPLLPRKQSCWDVNIEGRGRTGTLDAAEGRFIEGHLIVASILSISLLGIPKCYNVSWVAGYNRDTIVS